MMESSAQGLTRLKSDVPGTEISFEAQGFLPNSAGRIQFFAVVGTEVPVILLTVGWGPFSVPRSCSWGLDTWNPSII